MHIFVGRVFICELAVLLHLICPEPYKAQYVLTGMLHK